MIRNLLLSAALLLIVLSCDQKNVPAEFDYGSVEENTYVNNYFGFKASIPDGWAVQPQQIADMVGKLGRETLANGDKNHEREIKAAEVNVAQLLTVFKHDLTELVSFNANIIINAENLNNYPGVINTEDYLKEAKKLLNQSQMNYTFADQIITKNVGGQEFAQLNATLDYMGLHISQELYTIIKDGFCLNVILSYTAEEDKEILNNFLENISWTK